MVVATERPQPAIAARQRNADLALAENADPAHHAEDHGETPSLNNSQPGCSEQPGCFCIAAGIRRQSNNCQAAER
jgi:hypothetical protein